MLADRVRMGSKKGEDELFLYNYGEIYGSVGEGDAKVNNGEVSYNSDHIKIVVRDFFGTGGNQSLAFDTPLTNLYSKVTIESELIRSFGDGGDETYLLHDTLDSLPWSPASNYLYKGYKEHSKNSITLDLPADANGKFFTINLFTILLFSESQSILKVYSIKLHN